MNSTTLDSDNRISRAETFRRFRMNGMLTAFKLKKYLPVMVLTNLSNFLLVTVDGLVVGNLLGPRALSSVHIFYPATIFLGVLSVLAACGISSCLSLHMGESDMPELPAIKATANWTMVILAALAGVVQIPIIYGMINSYHLSPELAAMTRQYALGIMVSAPFGLISTVGVNQLQIIGKMKHIMTLSVVEGLTNMALDVLFTGVLKMGVAGAGYGTACATILRCALTVLCLRRESDLYRTGRARPTAKYAREILGLGLADAAYMLMQAFLNYYIVRIILLFMGEEGGAVKGVCMFSLSLVLVLINGVQGSMRPLAGLLSGAKEWEGMHILMQQCFALVLSLTGVFTLAVLLFPQLFFIANGVRVIPAGGLTALRLFALHFAFKGCDTLFRAYFVHRNESRYSTLLTVAGYAVMPLFAYLVGRTFRGEWLMIAYLLSELIIFTCNLLHYRARALRDRQEMQEDRGLIYLTVLPDEAVEASQLVRRYADARGIDRRYAYRIALCLEEMVAYAQASQKNDSLLVQIMIRFRPDSAMLMMIDNGRCIALDEDSETRALTVSNYDLIRKIARSVKYQYIQDMNYTVIEI